MAIYEHYAQYVCSNVKLELFKNFLNVQSLRQGAVAHFAYMAAGRVPPLTAKTARSKILQ
jgi:hypothetical protein